MTRKRMHSRRGSDRRSHSLDHEAFAHLPPPILNAMNRNSALAALQVINTKVSICTQNEMTPEIIESLENAVKELIATVQGDAYAKDRTSAIIASLSAGIVASNSTSISYWQDVVDNVKALYSYISRRPDPTTGRVSPVKGESVLNRFDEAENHRFARLACAAGLNRLPT